MKQHKYFRELRYKQKLENDVKYRGRRDIYYITKEPDPRFRRENQFDRNFGRYGFEDKPRRGRKYYIYWDRPEVEYSAHEFQFSHNERKKFLKRESRRKVRRYNKEELLQHNQYHKCYDYWWMLD